jgi:hypothetical protein
MKILSSQFSVPIVLYTVENGNHTFGVSHPINGLQDVNKDFWMLLDNTLSFIEDEEI